MIDFGFLFVCGVIVVMLTLVVWFGPLVVDRFMMIDHKEREMRLKELETRAKIFDIESKARKRLDLTAGSFPHGNYTQARVLHDGSLIVLRPDRGIDYPALTTLHDTTHDKRQIAAPTMPETAVIEAVASAPPERVDFREGFARNRRALTATDQMPLLYLGESADEPIIVPLRDIYHLGFAGPTRSGKSSAIMTVISNLLLQGLAVILAFVDPLQKETRQYAGLAQAVPELFGDSPDKAMAVMRLVYGEILRRLKLPDAERLASPIMLVIIDELYYVSKLFDPGLVKMLEESYSLGAGANVFFLAGCQDMSMKAVPRMTKLNTRTWFGYSGVSTQQLNSLGLDAQLAKTMPRRKGLTLYSFPESDGPLEETSGLMQWAYTDVFSFKDLADRSPAPPAMAWQAETVPIKIVEGKEPTPGEKCSRVYRDGMSIRELEKAAEVTYHAARSYINARQKAD